MPMLIGGRTAGVIVLGREDGRPRFTDTDVAVLEELDRRLAAGWANVEAFAREHTVAETLQRALLPDAPPQIAGLDMAVRYLPATDGVHVGGDWYDVFPLGRDRVALAIGDVVGHSIDSASIMGQIRSFLRGLHPGPPGTRRRAEAHQRRRVPAPARRRRHRPLRRARPIHRRPHLRQRGPPAALVDSGQGRVGYLDGAPGPMLGASHRRSLPVEPREPRPWRAAPAIHRRADRRPQARYQRRL